MTVPHLDDEQLSAHLDGEAGADAATHLRSCPQCESRLARLEVVSSRLRGPVPLPPDEVREAALVAAREAWAAGRAGGAAGRGADVVALDGRRRLPRWALPLAAAAAALLVAVPVLSSLGDGNERAETTATADNGGSAGRDSGEVAGTDGGDLGEQSDPAALGLAIRGALPGAASEEALAAPPPPGLAGGESPQDGAAPEGAVPTTPQVASRAMTGTTTRAAGKPFVDPPCAATARATYGRGLGPLVYAARLRWQGEPAVVLAYRLAEAGAAGLDYRVLVMARDGCRLLVVQSL
ncbi:MAG: hypothetical protein CYG61_01305 [Actinobacteria bacterium]|nr:MAG: hypothetical protein CYG61_01305 [Actinomycetota bacterium]